jgi:hypothetical protein
LDGPDPQRVAKIVRKAAFHLRAFPGRIGNRIDLDADEILIAGDLHGHIGNFRHVVAAAELAARKRRVLVLQEFVHGPGRYANGGDNSHRVLDLAASLVCQFPEQVVLLPGNHEVSELTGRQIAKDGVGLNDLFARGLDHCYGAGAEDVRAAYLELFRSMPLAVVTPNRLMAVHTLPAGKHLDDFDPGILQRHGLPLDQAERGGSLYALLWGRDVSESNSERVAKLLDVDWFVTGHITCENGFDFPNSRQLIVDCHAAPSAFVLLSATEPLTIETLRAGVRTF